MEDNKKEFISLLESTGREDIQLLIDHLEEKGFFTAPCSGANHLCKPGGLLIHSLNVCNFALAMYCQMQDCDIKGVEQLNESSIIIATLLHDVGKCGDFGKEYYVPNVLKSGKLSDAKPYERNKELLYKEHSIMSLTTILKYIDLTEEEYHAIRFHDGLYETFNKSLIGTETPLSELVHFADMWCSRFVEVGL